MGYEDIVGYDPFQFGADIAGPEDIWGGDRDLAQMMGYNPNYQLVGAEGPPPAQQAALRQLAMKHAAALVPRQIRKANDFPLGFGPTVIAAGATVNIIVQPQTPFKGHRLVIPSDFAGAVLINDIKVGKNSQLPSSNPLPGRMFTEFGVGMTLGLDTASISQQISLSITNTSGAPITFTAGLIGKSVE